MASTRLMPGHSVFQAATGRALSDHARPAPGRGHARRSAAGLARPRGGGRSGRDRSADHPNPRVQKPGLALAGYLPSVKPGRLQVLGESEYAFLATMPDDEADRRLEALVALEVPAVLSAKGLRPRDSVLAECDRLGVPLLSTRAMTTDAIEMSCAVLEEELAPPPPGPRRAGRGVFARDADRRRRRHPCPRAGERAARPPAWLEAVAGLSGLSLARRCGLAGARHRRWLRGRSRWRGRCAPFAPAAIAAAGAAAAAATAAPEAETEAAFVETAEVAEGEAALAGPAQAAAPFAAVEPAAVEGKERPPLPEALLAAPGFGILARRFREAP